MKTPALALALALLAAGAPTLAAPARRSPPPPATAHAGVTPPAGAIAFLGLRPTETSVFGATSLAQLGEAQRLRAIAENVVGLLSGTAVLRHDDLRKLLGPTYLVELFDCRGEIACQLRIAAPLLRAGVETAITADSFIDGDTVRIRVRRLELGKGRVLDEAMVAIPRAGADTLPPWQDALQQIFQDTGAIRIATNVAEPICALDGRPCELGADGALRSVPEGEHVLELSKEGYRRSVQVLVVKRGAELRVALPLEELPIQAQKAPDPTSRVPTFEAPGETTRLAPFGFLRLAMGWDDANGGDREDPLAPPRGVADEGHFLVLPRPAVAGVTFQAPRRESGWQLRGAFSTAWVKDRTPEIDSAYAEMLKEDAGFRVLLGFGPGIVSGLTAGTLTLPEGFGDLAAGFIGVTLSKSFGPVVVEAFGGRHKSQFTADDVPAGATPGPFGAARIAFVDERFEGKLYGEKYPLTIAVSGIVGSERLGLEDAELVGSVARVEDAAVWTASLEVHVPFGRHASFAGEAFVGENVHLLEGAAWQLPRVDPASGRHTALRSAGGWAQLSANLGPVELRLVGGTDRVLRGLDAGIAPDGRLAVRENRLLALNGVWYLLDHLALGLQVHAIRTRYENPQAGTGTLLGAAFTSQLKF